MLPLKDNIPSRNPPLLTWMLIFANAIVFIFELGMSGAELEAFFYRFGLVPARYSHPEWAVIAWWAHIGGFVAGGLLRFVFVPPRLPLQDDEYGIERAYMTW